MLIRTGNWWFKGVLHLQGCWFVLLWHMPRFDVPQIFMVWLWLWYVPQMFMAWLWLWYVPQRLWFGCGMLHQGWLGRGVVAAAPSLVTELSRAPCGNALTSLCSLNLLTCLNPAVSRYGFFWGSGSWRMVGGHLHMFATRCRVLLLGSEFLVICSWDMEDGWTGGA